MAEVNSFASIVANARSYYRLEGNANDSSPSAINATAVGTPTFSSGTGKYGQGVGLNGTSQYISAPNSSVIWAGSGGQLTYAMWFRIDGGDTSFGLVGCVDNFAAMAQGFSLSYGAATAGQFVFRGASAFEIGYAWTPDALWHHIAIQNSSGAGNAKIFLDGVQVASTTGSTSLLNPSGGPIVAIGGTQSGSSTNVINLFQGAIDDVLSTDQLLSASDIASLASDSSKAAQNYAILQAIKRASYY